MPGLAEAAGARKGKKAVFSPNILLFPFVIGKNQKQNL